MKMKLFGRTETKSFNFHRKFKNEGRGGVEPPLNPPPPGPATGSLNTVCSACTFKNMHYLDGAQIVKSGFADQSARVQLM